MPKKSKVLLLAKKELHRFFYDRRMVISALVFPAALLYLIYGLLAPLIIDFSMGEEKTPTVYALNPPAPIEELLGQGGITLTHINEAERDLILNKIAEEKDSFLVIFPPDFITRAQTYEAASGEGAPEIWLYYNSLSSGFALHYGRMIALLGAYERSIAHAFEINQTGGGDLAPPGDPERNFLAAVLPVFLLVFMFHGAMAATTEAFTGEKERGTLTTLFISSMGPMELAAGKVLGLSLQSLLCGLSGTLGICLALPRFIDSFGSLLASTQGLSGMIELGALGLGSYGLIDLGFLLLILSSTAALLVTIIALAAIQAKTAKEAQILVSPLLIIFLFISLVNIFFAGQEALHHYLIPIYNSVQSMGDIFNQSYSPARLLLAAGANLCTAFLGCIALAYLIKRESLS
ncbi:MAG: ABC transporter permease [Treponema sp.]|nr:ABC transporter permease [Treponema sp.]